MTNQHSSQVLYMAGCAMLTRVISGRMMFCQMQDEIRLTRCSSSLMTSSSRMQLGYALRRAQKVYLRIAGFPTDWEQLQPEVLGFRFQLDSCRYVDLAGAQHQVPEGEVDAAFADPLGEHIILLLPLLAQLLS